MLYMDPSNYNTNARLFFKKKCVADPTATSWQEPLSPMELGCGVK